MLLMPVVWALLAGAFWITWHAAKLDSRVERVELHLGTEASAAPPSKNP